LHDISGSRPFWRIEIYSHRRKWKRFSRETAIAASQIKYPALRELREDFVHEASGIGLGQRATFWWIVVTARLRKPSIGSSGGDIMKLVQVENL